MGKQGGEKKLMMANAPHSEKMGEGDTAIYINSPFRFCYTNRCFPPSSLSFIFYKIKFDYLPEIHNLQLS